MTEPAEAIRFLAFIAGWSGGRFPVYLDGAETPAAYVDKGDRLAERAARWDFEDSAQVEVGLPEERPGRGVGTTTVLWSWVESKDQVRRANRFKPRPQLVLRMGDSCRRLCLWAIKEPVPASIASSGNKRIAYALHAPQKYAWPERLRIPLPGTFIRVGRVRPAPVLVTRMELAAYNRTQVVATLRDPPPPWHVRQREKGLWR